MRTSLLASVAAALACLTLASCSIPIPQAEADPTRYYVLSTGTARGPAAPANAPTIRLRPIELASYLQGRALIVRRGENEIAFREFARWSEPLEQGIARVLREELLARGAAGAVVTTARGAGGRTPDLELGVRILSFEGGAEGAVIMRAVWELMRGGESPAVAARGDFRAAVATWDGQNEATLAARLSEAVSALAGEISAAVQK